MFPREEVIRISSLTCRNNPADRRHMHPRLFEAIACLRENTEWWDLELVQDMVAGLWDDRLKEVYNYDGIDDEMEMYDEEREDW